MWITPLAQRFICLVIATVAMTLPATTTVFAQQGARYEIVSSFEIADGRPNGVIRGRDGQLYGTTSGPDVDPITLQGQTGTVFAMDGAGARATLHVFFTNVRGDFPGTPVSNLFEGSDGNLYGTTYNVNTFPIDPGQIFRITPAGAFTSLSGAYEMRAGVIQARGGRRYGTTDGTRTSLFPAIGSVYRIETNNAFTTLHSFPGTDTAYPVAELVEADDGRLYGTTVGGRVVFAGGPPTVVPGAIFSIDPFTRAFDIRPLFTDGSRGRLIQASNGLLYGTTVDGGDFKLGTVFSFDRAGTLTTLHPFAGDDGANPNAGVIQAPMGVSTGRRRTAAHSAKGPCSSSM